MYRGEIKIPDTDGDGTPGPVAFGEQFDDYVLLKIDGVTLINNNAWNTAGSSGEFERADNEPDAQGTAGDGWYSIKARFGDSGVASALRVKLAGTSALASTPILQMASILPVRWIPRRRSRLRASTWRRLTTAR